MQEKSRVVRNFGFVHFAWLAWSVMCVPIIALTMLVWQQEGQPEYKSLLKLPLNSSVFRDSSQPARKESQLNKLLQQR